MNSTLYLANERIDRRKVQRDRADRLFFSHLQNCETCQLASFRQIKTMEHKCNKGMNLAIRKSIENKKVAYAVR